jgi:NCAIR mutase (PurE)-related protein
MSNTNPLPRIAVVTAGAGDLPVTTGAAIEVDGGGMHIRQY